MYPADDAAEAKHENLATKSPNSGVEATDKDVNVAGSDRKHITGVEDRTANGAGTASVGGDLSNGDSLKQVYLLTRQLCRTLRTSPRAVELLIAFARNYPRLQSGIVFNQYLSDLTGIMYRRLSTTVEEEVGAKSDFVFWIQPLVDEL